ncbi:MULTISPECIES: Rpn family recombination-promoting nuclease/putative transposase [Sphingobacterium]|uniref:Rpn family recombination-promoting nuclease/putative transposase n=1 Tax=Sphingobacterium TaxID=28453 RepID=UPI00257B8DB8|nr:MULTISPECIES: Rpn family recombination-promoting nuclease/putative transposase [Sphingobacterium]
MSITTTYIDPTTDFGFKRVFGTDANKDLLKAFLNELFRGRKVIADLHYNKNEHVGDTEEIGAVIFDLTCTADNGEQFIIEVQRSSQANLKRRMLYYGSKLISDQAPKGGRKDWNYSISEVYVIVLMDGFKMPNDDSKEFLHDICLCNRDTGKVFYPDLGFIYLELINFTKEESNLQNDLEGWLYVLKNMSSLDKLPTYLRKPVFEKLFKIAEYSKLSKEEKEMYDVSLKRKWDAEAVRQYQVQELAEAEKKARQEERAKADGEKRSIVRNLIEELRLTDDAIVRIAGVPLRFVQEVRANFEKTK